MFVEKKIKYNSCDDLPTQVFYEILNTNDLTLLGPHDKPEAVWIQIIDTYWELSDPQKYKSNIMSTISIIRKQNRLTMLGSLYVLDSMGIAKDEFYTQLKVSKGKILSTINREKTLLELATVKINKGVKDDIKYNFYKDLTQLELIFERSLSTDTVVSHWIELNRTAKEIMKQKKKQYGNNR